MKYGTVSAAPLATLATVAFKPTAWSFGAITACAPAPSAARRQAPRLCGSVTPSSTSSSGGPSTASSVSSSEWLIASASTRATTPWWREVPLIFCRRASSLSIRRAPAAVARSTNWRMRWSRRAGST